MLKTLLFDMDGTLLPMVQEEFASAYMRALGGEFASRGYDPEKFASGLWAGMAAMVKNDGNATNEEVFWDVFSHAVGKEILREKNTFQSFYDDGFFKVREKCGYDMRAGELIRGLKAAGYGLVLASNPIFPLVAQRRRAIWAGADPDDFDYITCYENSRYCKPNPLYFEEIVLKLDLKKDECLMVGNDAREDLAARLAGIDVFLLTNCLINRYGTDISDVPHGDFADLERYIAMKRNAE